MALLQWTQRLALEKLIKKFNDTIGSEKRIVVESFSQGNISDLSQEILNSLNNVSGSQAFPDLFLTYTDSAKKVDTMTELLVLDDYFSKEELDEYVDSFIEEGRFDSENNLKIFPIIKASEVMFVNKIFWKEFSSVVDVDYKDLSTWESLAKIAEKYYIYTDSLTPEKNDGKPLFARNSLSNYMIAGSKSLGTPTIDREHDTYHLNIDSIRTLWKNYYIPFVKGHYFSSVKYTSDSAKVGDVILYVGSSPAVYYTSDYVISKEGKKYQLRLMFFPLLNSKTEIRILFNKEQE